MKISSEKFLRLSLLIPYILGVVLICLSTFIDPRIDPNLKPSTLLQIGKIVAIPIALIYIIYFIGVPYWLIPYTLLATFLWIWSLKKDKLQIYKMFMRTPFLLAILTVIFSAVMSQFNFLWLSSSVEESLGLALLCAFPFSLIFGYVFIGLVAWIYEYAKKYGLIIDEELLILGETNN